MLKPFAFEELVARIMAIAWRHLPERGAVLRSGAVSLDTAARRVSVRGHLVSLTAKELSVLAKDPITTVRGAGYRRDQPAR